MDWGTVLNALLALSMSVWAALVMNAPLSDASLYAMLVATGLCVLVMVRQALQAIAMVSRKAAKLGACL